MKIWVKTVAAASSVWALAACGASSGDSPVQAADQAVAAQSEYRGAEFQRATLAVSDLDRALTLYRDILGFAVSELKELDSDSYAYPVFAIEPDAQLRFVTMGSPERPESFGLIEVVGMELGPVAPPVRSVALLRSQRLEADFEQITALGLETQPAYFYGGEEGAPRVVERSFTDFDGNRIDLYQILQEGTEE